MWTEKDAKFMNKPDEPWIPRLEYDAAHGELGSLLQEHSNGRCECRIYAKSELEVSVSAVYDQLRIGADPAKICARVDAGMAELDDEVARIYLYLRDQSVAKDKPDVITHKLNVYDVGLCSLLDDIRAFNVKLASYDVFAHNKRVGLRGGSSPGNTFQFVLRQPSS
jgi:hypothetical protein